MNRSRPDRSAAWKRLLARWCRRNPLVATLSAALVALLAVAAVAASVVAVSYYQLARNENRAKEEALKLAKSEKQAREDAVQQRETLRRGLSFQFVATGARALEQGDNGLAMLWFARALDLDRDDPERSWAHRVRLANTWRHTPRLIGVYRHDLPLTWAEMSPDNKRVATASYDGTARLWDVATCRQIGRTMEHGGFFVNCVCFSPDGKKVATAGGDGTTRLWDAVTGAPLGSSVQHRSGVGKIAFSPDGTLLASCAFDRSNFWAPPAGVDARDPRRLVKTPIEGKPSATVWNLATGTQVTLAVNNLALALDISADGSKVALTSERQQTIVVCDTSTGAVVAGPFEHGAETVIGSIVLKVLFSPDGQRLFTGTMDRKIYLWNVASPTPLASTDAGGMAVFSRGGDLSFGRHVWTMSPLSLRIPACGTGDVYDVAPGWATGVVLTREDNGYRLWDADAGQPLSPILPTMGPMARLGDGGRFLLVPGMDSAARLWDLSAQGPSLAFPTAASSSARYSADGRRLVTAGNQSVRVWDTTTRQPISPAFAIGIGPMDAALSPDGRRVVTGAADGTARFWDASTGREVAGRLIHQFALKHVDFDRTGSLVIVQTEVDPEHGWVGVWNARERRLLWHSDKQFRLHYSLSPDNAWLASCSSAGAVRLLDLGTGRPVAPEGKHTYWSKTPAFSPDNRLLASCGGDMQARVWELPGLQQRFAIPHQNTVVFAVFSPDGRRLATGDNSGDTRVWDSTTGKPVSPLLYHGDAISTLAFSPGDGRILLTGGRNKLVRAWDAATGELLGPPWRLNQMPTRAEFRPDGRQILIHPWKAAPELWDIDDDPRDVADWLLLARVQSGRQIDETGSVVPLTAAELADAWDELRRRRPEETAVPADRVRSWYQSEMIRLMYVGQSKDAWEVSRRAVAALPDDAELRLLRGITAGHAQLHDEARADLLSVMSQHPASAWMGLADAYIKTHREQEGIHALTELLRKEPKNAHAHMLIANLHESLREFDKVVEHHSAAIAMGEDWNGQSYSRRGRAQAEMVHFQ